MTEKITDNQLAGVISFSFHIGGFLKNTLHLDATEKGAYLMLLIAHYQSGGEGLIDDDKKLARISGVTLRKWMIIRPTIIRYFYIENGYLLQKKVIKELKKIHTLSMKQRAKALKRHNTSNATAVPRQCQPITNNQEPIKNKKEIVKAFNVFVKFANENNLSIPAKLTKNRESKLKARLKDCDGIKGWESALEKLKQSDFCMGRKTNFKANIDFLLQEKSFFKLMEGAYDNNGFNNNGKGNNNGKQSIKQQGADLLDSIRNGDFG